MCAPAVGGTLVLQYFPLSLSASSKLHRRVRPSATKRCDALFSGRCSLICGRVENWTGAHVQSLQGKSQSLTVYPEHFSCR
jgi:hypothetical protein